MPTALPVWWPLSGETLPHAIWEGEDQALPSQGYMPSTGVIISVILDSRPALQPTLIAQYLLQGLETARSGFCGGYKDHLEYTTSLPSAKEHLNCDVEFCCVRKFMLVTSRLCSKPIKSSPVPSEKTQTQCWHVLFLPVAWSLTGPCPLALLPSSCPLPLALLSTSHLV